MLGKGDEIKIPNVGHVVGQIVNIASQALGGAIVAVGKVIAVGAMTTVKIIPGQRDDQDGE